MVVIDDGLSRCAQRYPAHILDIQIQTNTVHYETKHDVGDHTTSKASSKSGNNPLDCYLTDYLDVSSYLRRTLVAEAASCLSQEEKYPKAL